MDQGAIVEEGTHDELMQKQGKLLNYWVRQVRLIHCDSLKSMFILILGFYHKLVTTGNENKPIDEIETLPEEGDGEDHKSEPMLAPRTDVRRKSTKRLHRHHSTKRGLWKSFGFIF